MRIATTRHSLRPPHWSFARPVRTVAGMRCSPAIVALIVVAAGVGATSGVSAAARVRNCGDLAHSGAGNYNVTSRGVSCKYARGFARDLPSEDYATIAHF